jgi:hypothetical protein
MQEFRNWKEFINQVLIDSGQFADSTSELVNQTEIETFKSTKKNSLTEIKAGYLDKNLLIYLQILNPKTPGYNKFTGSEYFENNSFDFKVKRTKVGLDFNEKNMKGILNFLKSGLGGTETQFILNGKILKSIIDVGDHPMYITHYNFTKRSFFKELFSKRIEKMEGIEKKEIKLHTIFKGI